MEGHPEGESVNKEPRIGSCSRKSALEGHLEGESVNEGSGIRSCSRQCAMEGHLERESVNEGAWRSIKSVDSRVAQTVSA